MTELKKDEIFFRTGGVTFSGGEPFMQPEFLIDALDACGAQGYHRCVDTCGFTQRARHRRRGKTHRPVSSTTSSIWTRKNIKNTPA